jgi:hypothetical protein
LAVEPPLLKVNDTWDYLLELKIHVLTEEKIKDLETKMKTMKSELETLKAKFVAESAKKVSGIVSSHLKGELSQLKEDIKSARKNNFGRKIYESFASEFSTTYLNDKAETRKVMQVLEHKNRQLEEAKTKLQQAATLVESKNREVRIIRESTQREQVMGKLLSTLNKEKAQVMSSLLESVQTPKLQNAFDKYLPAVLNTGSAKPAKATASVIVEATGDKAAKQEVDMEQRDNVIDIKRLAGL